MKPLGNNLYEVNNPKTGEVRQVNGDDLHLYGLQPESGFSTWLPSLLGTAGSVGGGIVGGLTTFGLGAEAGSVAGGAVGQSLGEIAKEWLNHEQINLQEVGKQGAIGAAYGAIPGSESLGLGAKVGSKILGRAITGGVVSGATTGVEESTDPTKTLGQKAKDVAVSGGVGAALFPIIGSSIDAMSGIAKFLGNKIPNDIYQKVIQEPMQVAKDLSQATKAWLVGNMDVSFAEVNKIIPADVHGVTPEMVTAGLDRAGQLAQETENKLRGLIKASGVSIPVSQAQQIISDAGEKIMSGSKLRAFLDNANALVFRSAGANRLETELGAGSILKRQVPLETLLDVKRVIKYGSDTSQAWHEIASKIESLSGNGQAIHEVNNFFGKVLGVQSSLQDKVGITWPDKWTPTAIQNAIEESARGIPKSLDALISSIAAAAAMGTAMGTKSAGMGISGMMAARWTMQKVGASLFDNPKEQKRLADYLSKKYLSVADSHSKDAIKSLLQQMGVRFAGTLGQSVNESSQ